ncbi:MAG: hypothetical protein ABIL62_02390 [Planctomycetota bacterium]
MYFQDRDDILRSMICEWNEETKFSHMAEFDHLKVYMAAEASTIPYIEVATKMDMTEGAGGPRRRFKWMCVSTMWFFGHWRKSRNGAINTPVRSRPTWRRLG